MPKLLIGLLFFVVGGALTIIIGYGLVTTRDIGIVVPGLIGALLFYSGIKLLGGYMWPSIGVGAISKEFIRCELDGKLVQEICGPDVLRFRIREGNSIRHKAVLRSKRTVRVNPFYFPDYKQLRRDLEACGYLVT